MKSTHLMVIVTLLVVLIACAPIQAPSTQPAPEKVIVQCWDGSTAASIQSCPPLQVTESTPPSAPPAPTAKELLEKERSTVKKIVDDYNFKFEELRKLSEKASSTIVVQDFESLDKTDLDWIENEYLPKLYEFKNYMMQNEEVLGKNGVDVKSQEIKFSDLIDATEDLRAILRTSVFISAQQENNLPDIKQPSELSNCPDLSKVRFHIAGESPLMGGWQVILYDYKTSHYELKYSYVFTSSGGYMVTCKKGSDAGQNINYLYCGDIINSIVLISIDESGNIGSKRSIQLVFDTKNEKYVSAECDTYHLL